MQYTVNRGEKGKVEVKVDIPKATFVASYGDVLEALGKDAKIAGFRPGNIPKDVLENNVGLTKILNETASFLVSKHLGEIFKKEGIVPIGNPNIAIDTLTKDSPFSFTATLITKPKVKLGDWKKIKIKKVAAKEVTEKDVNESIKNIYDAWRKQKGAKGSNELDESEKDGSSFATSDAEAMEVEKASEDSKKFIYDARGEKIFLKDEATLSTSEESKPTSEVRQALDDEFAKAIGARDLKHLRELVRGDLEKIVLEQVEAKLEQELFDEILKLTSVEVPDILIDDELNRIIVRITQNLEAQGKKLEDYLKEENTTLDGLKAKLRPQAETNVKVTLVMDEVGRKEAIKVTGEEIEEAAKGVDDSKLTDAQKVDLRNYLAVSIFQAKTLDLVKKAVAS